MALGKLMQQLFFTEVISQTKSPSSLGPSESTMVLILKDRIAVGHLLEAMEVKMTDLMTETKLICVLISGFHNNVEGLDLCLTSLETRVELFPDRNHWDFLPLLEIQKAHRLQPRRPFAPEGARVIIACFLLYEQACQILKAERAHRPYDFKDHKIQVAVYFSSETNSRCRAFLSLWPQLRMFSLFEPTQMCITMDGKSKNFYDPKALQAFLEGLPDGAMDMTPYPPGLSSAVEDQ
ncbi:hypothetical protein NDU88_003754 [Pleurodeles waltl]|uniref:Uncharacterized protein n=1 Tax=Pleurodeles waltl TaxID=8319 RepID=A0AAV7T670_PLEWA|nr:hypothetical protein NDU88_003754 [Pleurodeles waltl]